MRARFAPLATAVAALVVSSLAALPTVSALVTAADPAAEVHFTAAGDYGAGPNSVAVFNLIGQIDPDLNLALGDLSYGTTGAEQAWCDLVTGGVGAGFPFQLLAGNHESNGVNGNINDFSACLPNQLPGLVGTYGRQWYVDVPAVDPLVRYVMISPALTFPDGTWSYAAGSPRYAWTAAAIDGARSAEIPWVVVGMHKPCLSMGVYTCDTSDLLSLFASKKVDLVLNGHEHMYQRTQQLGLGTGCASLLPGTADPDCIVDSDASMVKGAGTVFATVGTGGVVQRDVVPSDPEAPYFATSSGLATSTWGVLDVHATATTLSAQFVRASGGSFTDAFTIGAGGPVANVPPTGALTATCTALTCAFDASGSTDPDGTIASYRWDFGDGSQPVTTATPTASRTFSTAGTYTATVTVTDDDGATGSASRAVTPTAAPTTVTVAADTFARTASSGLGTADTGGAWRTTGSASAYSVSSGTGRIVLAAPGAGPDVSLPSVASASTDLTVAVTTDKPATGSGLYVSVVGRRVAGAGDYRAKLHLRTGGAVAVSVVRVVGSTETALTSPVVVSGLTHVPGERLRVRVQASGASPTTVQARVWKDGMAEPTTWHASRTDSTTALQAAGSVGLMAYLSSSASNAPITLVVDDVLAQTP